MVNNSDVLKDGEHYGYIRIKKCRNLDVNIEESVYYASKTNLNRMWCFPLNEWDAYAKIIDGLKKYLSKIYQAFDGIPYFWITCPYESRIKDIHPSDKSVSSPSDCLKFESREKAQEFIDEFKSYLRNQGIEI